MIAYNVCVGYIITVKECKAYEYQSSSILSSRQPKFNLILVKNTSRFARNVSVSDILNELKQKGVYVHFLDLNKG